MTKHNIWEIPGCKYSSSTPCLSSSSHSLPTFPFQFLSCSEHTGHSSPMGVSPFLKYSPTFNNCQRNQKMWLISKIPIHCNLCGPSCLTYTFSMVFLTWAWVRSTKPQNFLVCWFLTFFLTIPVVNGYSFFHRLLNIFHGLSGFLGVFCQF